MNKEEFHEKLVESKDIGFGITKYQHVERLGSSDVEGLLDPDGPIIVQEKLDGANMTVALVDGKIVIYSRNNMIYDGSEVLNKFNGAVDYVLNHTGLIALFQIHPDWILRGEWLVKHTINYPADAWKKFYVFDIQVQADDGLKYLNVLDYDIELTHFDVKMVPLIAYLNRKVDMDELIQMADRESALGDTKAEGIVVKRPNFVNKYFRQAWGKVVNSEFKTQNAIEFGKKNNEDVEADFVGKHLQDSMIDKVIANIEHSEGRKLESRDIHRVLGTVWHDLVQEEIWSFLKRKKNPTINFGKARRLSCDKTRSYVLAYLSGGLRGG